MSFELNKVKNTCDSLCENNDEMHNSNTCTQSDEYIESIVEQKQVGIKHGRTPKITHMNKKAYMKRKPQKILHYRRKNSKKTIRREMKKSKFNKFETILGDDMYNNKETIKYNEYYFQKRELECFLSQLFPKKYYNCGNKNDYNFYSYDSSDTESYSSSDNESYSSGEYDYTFYAPRGNKYFVGMRNMSETIKNKLLHRYRLWELLERCEPHGNMPPWEIPDINKCMIISDDNFIILHVDKYRCLYRNDIKSLLRTNKVTHYGLMIKCSSNKPAKIIQYDGEPEFSVTFDVEGLYSMHDKIFATEYESTFLDALEQSTVFPFNENYWYRSKFNYLEMCPKDIFWIVGNYLDFMDFRALMISSKHTYSFFNEGQRDEYMNYRLSNGIGLTKFNFNRSLNIDCKALMLQYFLNSLDQISIEKYCDSLCSVILDPSVPDENINIIEYCIKKYIVIVRDHNIPFQELQRKIPAIYSGYEIVDLVV